MTLNDYLKKALAEGWATGHFNASESDQFRAICEAAKELNTIAIIGTSEGEAKHIGYFEAVALRDAFRKELGIPIFLNADHHKSVDAAKKAVDAGYDSIHIDLSHLSFEENVKATKEVVDYSKFKNPKITVEGEVGYWVTESSKIYKEVIKIPPESLTKPEEAEKFAKATGVHRFAPAVGNLHGITANEPVLDIERIQAIRGALPKEVALVLHGGSGIPTDQIKRAIKAGIANVHINTELRVAYAEALRAELSRNPEEVVPYKFDAAAREAVKKIVKQKLILFGSENKT